MCDEDDEIAMYCKLAEQNFFEAFHHRRLSQSKSHVQNIHNQSTESPA